MKKIVFIFLAMVFCASFAFAQTVDVRNDLTQTQTVNTTATGIGIAGAKSEANAIGIGNGGAGGGGGAGGQGGAGGSAQSNNNLVIEDKLQFLAAPVPGAFLNPGIPIDSTEWKLVCPAIYKTLTKEQVNMRKRKFLLSDLLPWNWKKHVHATPLSNRLPGTPNSISCMSYWPEDVALPGDEAILAVKVDGDAGFNDEAFHGLALESCIEDAGSDRYAMLKKTNSDGVSSGAAVNIGGATSSIDKSTGTTIVGGGQLGVIKTSVEKRTEYRLLCMNKGALDLPKPPEKLTVVPTPAPPVVELKKPESAPPICSQGEISELYNRLERNRVEIYGDSREKKGCDVYSLNNLRLRSERGNLFFALYECTGDRESLKMAIENYEIAARNYKFGHDISKFQVEADEIIASVYKNWQKANEAQKAHK